VTVQVISDAGSTVTPDRRSSLDCTVSVTCAFRWTRARTEIFKSAGTLATSGVVVGFASGNVTLVAENVTRAWAGKLIIRTEVPRWASIVTAARRITAELTNPVRIQETKAGDPMRHRTETPALAFLLIG
jgi:hypothetical protein